jgi:uncharacterized membrane protein YczE
MALPVQLHQLINLVSLVVLAYALGTLQLSIPTLAILSGIVAFIDIVLFKKRAFEKLIPYTAVTTLLGTVLILYASHIYIYATAAVAGVVQKHILRFANKALFNPSNFAVIFALSFFGGMCGIKEGHLGEYPLLLAAVFVMGVWVLLRAERLLIPLVYVVVYAVFVNMWLFKQDPTLYAEAFVWRYISVATVVFLMFMLTDPKTTPHRWYMQIAFAAATAGMHAWLDILYTPRLTHPFEALFIVSPVWNIVTARQSRQKRVAYAMAALAITVTVTGVLEHSHLFRAGYES